jgi:hypothetical protein
MSQLRDFQAELETSRSLCERVLAVLGEPTPEPEPILIRTDAASVDLAIARAPALAEKGIFARLELCDGDC